MALAKELAGRLAPLEPAVVCGPLAEGAFVALLVATELAVDFMYTERLEHSQQDEDALRSELPNEEPMMSRVRYRLPAPLRDLAKGKRVVVVNDVINAGSALGGTLEQLDNYELETIAIGSLLTLGSGAEELAGQYEVELVTLASLHNPIWLPTECPLCADGLPLENPGEFPSG